MTNEQRREYERLLNEARGILMDAREYASGDVLVKRIDYALSKVVRARTMLLKYA